MTVLPIRPAFDKEAADEFARRLDAIKEEGGDMGDVVLPSGRRLRDATPEEYEEARALLESSITHDRLHRHALVRHARTRGFSIPDDDDKEA